MTARGEILTRLEQRDFAMPQAKKRAREFTNRVEKFSQVLEASKGEVILVDNLGEALVNLALLFEEFAVKTVAVNREPPLSDFDLSNQFPNQDWKFSDEEADFRNVCSEVDVGVTSATYALAETGSLVISSGPNKSRLTSLLPPVHIVLLPEHKILNSIFDWVELRPDKFPSNLVFVSGPSKTADIEQTLVVGVHGPKRLIVIIYPEDDSLVHSDSM